MKKFLTSLPLAISFFFLGVGMIAYFERSSLTTAAAKQGARNCALSDLKGSYGYTLTGFFSPSPGLNVPLAAVGVATIGEDGSMANNDTLVVNGVVTENRMYAGTITLNPDNPCTGKMIFDNGLKDNFVVTGDGNELQFIQIAPEAPAISLQTLVTGAAKRF